MNTVAYLHLTAEAPLPELSSPAFKAILVADCPVSEGWRERVAEWLVRGGCLYLVSWGDACEAWHDSVDVANSHDFEWRTIPDDKFVITTWHEGELLEEAMWFAAHAAEHPTVDLVVTLIIHVAAYERRDALLGLYQAAADD